MISLQHGNHRSLLHEKARGHGGRPETRWSAYAQLKSWLGLAMLGLIWGPGVVLGGTSCRSVTAVEDRMPPHAAQVFETVPDGHEDVLLAGFGFQSPASSSITIRAYERQTGALLSEEDYDLNVQEGGTSKDSGHARIFAGGIGMDRDGRSRFLLRVYDAANGHFLWEGQLNLVGKSADGLTRPIATVAPSLSASRRTGMTRPSSIEVQFSLRAVDPHTGRLVWEDRFTPGTPKIGRVQKVASSRRAGQIETIRHIFDLVVRAVDRTSGRLLWQDSFEDTAASNGREEEGQRFLEPGSMPEGRGRRETRSVDGAVWIGSLQPIAVGTCRRTTGACLAWPSRSFAGL
jgi:hypothetical protein